MALLESGPARADRIYWLVVLVIAVVLGAYFVYDGLYGYPNRNREEAHRQLQRWSNPPFALGERPTEQDFKALQKDRPTTREQVRKTLGHPVPPKSGSAGTDIADRYASLYGMITVPYDTTGRVDLNGLRWEKWGKSKEEIQGQLYWAALAALIAVYPLYRFWKAATLRAAIDEEGMTYGGTRIAFADMVALRDYNPKGWVDLYYRTGDSERKLRIDDQKIARFDEITTLIGQKAGLENPVAAARREQTTPAGGPPQG
jgi:hypothetical protein